MIWENIVRLLIYTSAIVVFFIGIFTMKCLLEDKFCASRTWWIPTQFNWMWTSMFFTKNKLTLSLMSITKSKKCNCYLAHRKTSKYENVHKQTLFSCKKVYKKIITFEQVRQIRYFNLKMSNNLGLWTLTRTIISVAKLQKLI